MTDQNMIPAEKVRGVINEIDSCLDGTYLNDQARRALEATKVSIENILPAPPQPTTGLLGRWAKHDAYGDVVVISDYSSYNGKVWVSYTDNDEPDGASTDHVPFDSLMFPEQAMKPEEVPAGEAWLVDVNAGELSLKSALAIKDSNDTWLTLEGATRVTLCSNGMITLLAPLTPERPVSDLQAKSTERALDRMKAKYDEIEWEYKQAQAEITWLKAGNTPRIVATPEEYDALPVGSQVRASSTAPIWQKSADGLWEANNGLTRSDLQNRDLRTVVRYGWGDEQPAWRIEAHNPDNFRVGEFIIDIDGDSGTVTPEWIELWDTDEDTFGARRFAPFIVFPSKDAATPEAIEEAKRARDKEMGK